MTESCTTTPQPASPNEGNWARRITDKFNSVGFTIEGMPEYLSRDQAMSMLESFQAQHAVQGGTGMSTTTAVVPDFHCPIWCAIDHATDDHPRDWANPSHLSADLETPTVGINDPVSVALGRGADGTFFDVNGSTVTRDGAREVMRNIEYLIDMATPASPGSVAILQALADELGVTIELPATKDDVRELSLWLGEQIAEVRA